MAINIHQEKCREALSAMQPCCCWADIGNCYRATGRAESTHGLFLQHTRARVHLPPLLLRVSVFVFIILGRRGGRPAWAARRQAPTAINAPNSDKINSDSAACIVLSCLFKSRATFRCVRLYTHNMHAYAAICVIECPALCIFNWPP
jgi:hypothetical protein